MGSYEFIEDSLICSGRWLRLKEYKYRCPNGSVKTWEVAERTTRSGTTDGIIWSLAI